MSMVTPNFAGIFIERAYNKRLQPLLEYALVAASPGSSSEPCEGAQMDNSRASASLRCALRLRS